jgi:hypothetical protein
MSGVVTEGGAVDDEDEPKNSLKIPIDKFVVRDVVEVSSDGEGGGTTTKAFVRRVLAEAATRMNAEFQNFMVDGDCLYLLSVSIQWR